MAVGAEPRRCRRLLASWLALDVTAFQLACGQDGTPIGVLNMIPLQEPALASLEPVLQQFTEPLAWPPEHKAGIVPGFVCAAGHPRARAELLMHCLQRIVAAGRTVAATPWPEYQRLAERCAGVFRGEVRHDPYQCGRTARLYTVSFGDGGVTGWVDQVMAACGRPGTAAQQAALTAQAFEELHDPAGLTAGVLFPGASREEVKAWLIRAAQQLAATPDRAHAEAGLALVGYYVDREGPHEAIAARMHSA